MTGSPPADRIDEAAAERRTGSPAASEARSGPEVDERTVDLLAQVEFWRNQYELERERLAKLWVAYKDLDAQLEAARRQAAEAKDEEDEEDEEILALPPGPPAAAQPPEVGPEGGPRFVDLKPRRQDDEPREEAAED